MEYFNAFLLGVILCVIGQVLLDRTSLTPARILVFYVVAGVILSGLGLYQPLVDWAGAGPPFPSPDLATPWPRGCARPWRRRAGWGCSPEDSPPPLGVSPWPSPWVLWHLSCFDPDPRSDFPCFCH